MKETIEKLQKEGKKVLSIKVSIPLEDVKTGILVKQRVTLSNIHKFCEVNENNEISSIPYDYIHMIKGIGEHQKELLAKVDAVDWDYAREDENNVASPIITYEQEGFKLLLIDNFFLIGEIIQ